MIKILHVVGLMNKGGIETLIMNVLRNKDAALQMDILCTMPGIGDYDDEVASLGSGLFHLSESLHENLGKLRYSAQFQDYYRWFKRHKYEAVHLHGSHAFDLWIAYKACLAAGCQNILVHSHNTTGEHRRLNDMFAKKLGRSNAKLLACSDAAGRWMFGTDARWTVVRNGIDVAKFKYDPEARAEVRTTLTIPPDAHVIAHTGRFMPQKNQAYFIRLLGALEEFGISGHVILIGDGPDLEAVRRGAAEAGLVSRMSFVGTVPDVERYLSAADYFVMPSLYEGLPLACVEAQANGLPCLLSSAISSEARITQYCDFFELDNEASACALAMRDIEMPRKRDEAGFVVRAAGYDINETVARLTELYRS